jgi:P4 family phage/plasmid primase-like protien
MTTTTPQPTDALACLHDNGECPTTPENVTVIPFVERHRLKWQPINLDIKWDENKQKYDKKLQPSREYNHRPSSKDFENLDDEVLKERQSYLDSYDHIAIDSGNIYHIDVDNLNMSPELRSQVEEWKTQWPYYLSASKKLPHFFVRFDEAFENDRVAKTKFEGIEILSGQWGWCHKAAEIFNAEKDIPMLKKSRWVDEHRVKGASHPQPIKDVNREVNKTPLLYTEVEIKNILYHIDVYYCDGYESWFRIGCALYNSGYAQEVFDEFSKRSTKYDSDEITKLWNSFEKKPYKQIQFGTIMHYLDQSNSEFAENCREQLKTPKQLNELNSFFQTGSMTHHKAALIFHELFKHKFSYSKGEWFMLNEGGIYERLEKDALPILARQLKSCLQRFLNDVIKSTDDEDKRKKLFRAMALVEDFSFKQKCIEEAKLVFINENLQRELDSNTNLIGFTNGVYDLNELKFRKATINDKVSLTTRYPHTEDVDMAKVQYIDDLITNYFESEDVADWFKKHLGSLLQGGNKEEKAYFWTGKGRNGKGTIDHLLINSLGDYYVTINKELYTCQQKNSEAPAPEICGLKHKRCGMTRELEEGVPILEGVFKDKTGNDEMKARNLHEKKHEMFKPTHTTIIQTNDMPVFTNVTIALCARLIVIEFVFQYKDPLELNIMNKYHRPVDTNLKSKLKNCGAEFMHLLIKWFKKYNQEGLIYDIPEQIASATNAYKRTIDTVKTFMEECVEQGADDDVIKMSRLLDLHDKYSSTKMTAKKFTQRLMNYGYVMARKRIEGSRINCISGYKLIPERVFQLEEDVVDGEM